MIQHTLRAQASLDDFDTYNGYWFWSRPSAADLWHDLRAVVSEIRAHWDMSAPGLREAWTAGDFSPFLGWNKRGAPKTPPNTAKK